MSKPAPKISKTQSDPLAVPHRIIRMMLGLICFVAGAAVMIVEISANRLLAPNFGNSLHTWTALIGVILIAFSAGGYLGGYWADKFGRMNLLGWLLAGAAVLTMLIPAINTALSPSFAQSGLISGPVFISLFLFALPGILLGAVSPASVRFYSLAGHDEHVGSAAGTISMLGSLGSFVGTFLSGFVLLSSFGVKAIFLGTGVVLLLLALVAFLLARSQRSTLGQAGGAALVAFFVGFITEPPAQAGVLHTQNSFYHRIEVHERDGIGSKERILKLDSTVEGGMREKDGGLILDYQRYWQLAQLNENLKLQRALFIGAGAFGMPEQLSKLNPEAQVDVVEIDPAVIETGRLFFKLNEFPNVHPYAGDARRFLKGTDQTYDLIFGDAYNGIRHIPAHLVTKEFFTEVRSRLSDDGVFLMNVITAVEGPHSELLSAILGTLRSVFPQVEVFAVHGAWSDAQNVILLASMKPWTPWIQDRFYAAGTVQSQMVRSHVPARHLPEAKQIFTDDWNPVDAVIARQLLR
jgi:spermidine synthase